MITKGVPVKDDGIQRCRAQTTFSPPLIPILKSEDRGNGGLRILVDHQRYLGGKTGLDLSLWNVEILGRR